MSWRRLKHYCDGPPEYGLNVSSDAYVDDGFRLLRTTDIDDDGALSPDSEGVFVGRHLIGPRHVLRPGDLLFSRAGSLGRCFRVPQEARDLTFAGYLVRFRPLPSFEPRYIEYCASAAFAQASIRADAVTSTISNFNAERYGNLLLPDSDPEQQRAIADYLDRETARIDALIEKKQRMLELLEERLQVQVDLATVPGDEPLVSLRRYVSDACDGPFGSALKSEHYTESGARVIRLGNIGRASWSDGDVARIPFGYWAELEHHHAQAGDVVIAGLGDEGNPVGRACVLPELGPALVKADCYRLRLREGAADGVYLAWYLSSRRGLANAERMAEGSTRPRLTLAKALALPIPLLTVDRQHAIARCLVDQFARFEAVKKPLSSQIALLQEHRQALVTAAVTGELEVTGATA